VTGPTPTLERERPEIASAIEQTFGAREPLAVRYADLLVTDGIDRGLLGPREADRVWERHLLNSAALAPLIPPGARVVDLGSGAGLPGIPLALARPDLRIVLLEPMQRRVRFLAECLDVLALPGVCVHHGRAEAGLGELAEVVVARAVARLDRLMRLSFELLIDNGTLLALKGRDAAGELDALAPGQVAAVEMLSVPAAGQPATVIRATRPARPGRGRDRRSGKGSR
jgi:16S rRNA (guanine527-N7)-methyltransferase